MGRTSIRRREEELSGTRGSFDSRHSRPLSVGIFNARLILSFSGTHEPSAPTTSGITVPMSAYLDFLRSDALARFETSSNGHVTSITICGC